MFLYEKPSTEQGNDLRTSHTVVFCAIGCATSTSTIWVKLIKVVLKMLVKLATNTLIAACKNVGEIDNWSQFHQHFTHAFFIQKRFFCQNVTREKLQEALSYKKCARKMLVKFTTERRKCALSVCLTL